MVADVLTIGLWFLVALLGVLAGSLQRRGRDYYPANLLLGLACGTNSVFYLALLGGFRGDVGALRQWSLDTRAGLWVNLATILILLWSLYLVVRANRAKPGSALDLAGHAGPPTTEQIDEALAVLERSDHHGVANAIQRSRMRGWLALMGGRAARNAQAEQIVETQERVVEALRRGQEDR